MLTHIPISPLPPERFREVLGPEYAEVEEAIIRARSLLAGRAIWHINSTAAGGGVAELLHSLLAYARGAGVDVRWSVMAGEARFFEVTKRLHNQLHGLDGGEGGLDASELAVYRDVADRNAEELAELVRPGDVVYLHDPQTAGLVERMVEAGAIVIWRCHIGGDHPNETMRGAWSLLRPLIEPAHSYVFSRPEYIWEGLDSRKAAVITPSIDAFSPKNEDLPPATVTAILDRIGLTPNGGEPAIFRRLDGTVARVDRRARIEQDGPLPPNVPVLTQVSRWDGLKDPVGVLRGFVEYGGPDEAHLLLVGPVADGVSDDPEGAAVFQAVREARLRLDARARVRVHLVSLPMDDIDENAAMVNAIQRRSTVIAQKSLAEGFGLTATEAMWKSRPVVAGAVGGLNEQVVDGLTGRLVDPTDLEAFGRAAGELLGDPSLAAKMGAAGRERVREKFLGTRHLMDYVRLLAALLAEQPAPGSAAET
ncbi:MAG: glycosyltransferase [Solirubrobacterales bacterium]